MNLLFCLGLAMAVGLLFNRLAKRLGLPNVTGYLVAGLLIGPFVFKLFPADYLEQASVITTVALGFIAFSIGGEFNLVNIKSIGKSILTITWFESLSAVILVDATLLLLGFDPPLAITLGAIAAATAPAATMMVVRQYKAEGPVARILLPVVAMDDAVGLIAFSISISIAQVLVSGTELTVSSMLLTPLLQIAGALVIGGALGLFLAFSMRFFKSRANRLCLIVAAVFLGTALAEVFSLSALLLCMSIGAVMVNLRQDSEKILEINDRWTPPLFLLFFVLSGTGLDFTILPTVGLLGVVYLVVRSLGKYLGARIGSTLVHQEHNVRKYLGIALLPQAGVAIGMSQLVISLLPAYGNQIRAVILCATLIYELVGPVLTKIALTRAGEIQKPERIHA